MSVCVEIYCPLYYLLVMSTFFCLFTEIGSLDQPETELDNNLESRVSSTKVKVIQSQTPDEYCLCSLVIFNKDKLSVDLGKPDSVLIKDNIGKSIRCSKCNLHKPSTLLPLQTEIPTYTKPLTRMIIDRLNFKTKWNRSFFLLFKDYCFWLVLLWSLVTCAPRSLFVSSHK